MDSQEVQPFPGVQSLSQTSEEVLVTALVSVPWACDLDNMAALHLVST